MLVVFDFFFKFWAISIGFLPWNFLFTKQMHKYTHTHSHTVTTSCLWKIQPYKLVCLFDFLHCGQVSQV
jgi:hypothetical protein